MPGAQTGVTGHPQCVHVDSFRYAGFVKSTVSGLVTWAFATDATSRAQVKIGSWRHAAAANDVLMLAQVWVNGGAVAFSACFTSAACANAVSAVRKFKKNIIRYVLDAHDWNNQVFVAASGQHYEVIVEYKGTKASGAPLVAAAAGWGSSNVYARLAHDFMMRVQRRVVYAPQV